MSRKRRFAIVLIAGAALTVACGVIGGVQLAGAITSVSPQPVPGQFHISLASGQWEIYELIGTRSGVSAGGVSFSVTHEQAPIITASMVTVTAPGGIELPVQNQSGNTTQTLQNGSSIYTGVANFQAPRAGNYSVSVAAPGASVVVVARPVLAELRALLPWIAGALLGAACALIGLIGVIVAHRRHPPASVTPPG